MHYSSPSLPVPAQSIGQQQHTGHFDGRRVERPSCRCILGEPRIDSRERRRGVLGVLCAEGGERRVEGGLRRAPFADGDAGFGWDVSSVTGFESMAGMFYAASAFYQNLNMWQLSDSADTNGIFQGATKMCEEPSYWPQLVSNGCPLG